jgi:hypothetical protein
MHYLLGSIVTERRLLLVGKNESVLSGTINALLWLVCGDAPFPSILVCISMRMLGLMLRCPLCQAPCSNTACQVPRRLLWEFSEPT